MLPLLAFYFPVGTRVAFGPHTDQFMRGQRYGEVTSIRRTADGWVWYVRPYRGPARQRIRVAERDINGGAELITRMP